MARYRVGLETRRRILDACRWVLGDRGLEGATLKAICERAEVGAGSFYNLFDSKEACVLEVVNEAIRAVDPDPAGEHDSVAELAAAFVRFTTGNPDLARIYLQIAVGGSLTDAGLSRRLLRHHERRVERFAHALRQQDGALSATQARLDAHSLLATLTGLALYWLVDPSQPFEQQVQALVARHVAVT